MSASVGLVLSGITKRGTLYIHACMAEHRWVTAHACSQLHPDALSLWLTTHSHTVALWLLPSMAFLLQIQSDCGTKLSPVSQNPPSALYASARPSLCVPSSGSLCAGLGGLLWNVLRRGRQAGLKGVRNSSHTQHPPPTDMSPTWPFGGGKAKDTQR